MIASNNDNDNITMMVKFEGIDYQEGPAGLSVSWLSLYLAYSYSCFVL